MKTIRFKTEEETANKVLELTKKGVKFSVMEQFTILIF